MDAIKFTIKEAAQQKALDLSKEHKSIFYVIYCHKTEALWEYLMEKINQIKREKL